MASAATQAYNVSKLIAHIISISMHGYNEVSRYTLYKQ